MPCQPLRVTGPPTFGSLSATSWSVLLPELVTVKEYVIVEPAVAPFGTPDFTRWMPGSNGSTTVSPSLSSTEAPVGGVPTTDTSLTTDPASTSACVIVYGAVAVTDCPGASVWAAPGQAATLIGPSPGSGSAMAMSSRVTLPVLVTRKE